MRKKLFFLATLLLVSITLQAQEEKGIKFVQGTLDEAFIASKQAGKPLFVDIWASWCGPCKRLAREIFPQEKVGNFFNEHFVCYQLQTDPKDPEALKKAREFSKKYYVQLLPTLVWIDTNGELMHYTTGFMEADALIAQARMALDPKQRSAQHIKRWKAGDRSAETGMNYFKIFNQETEELDKWYQNLTFEERTDSTMSAFMAWRISLPATSTTYEYVARNWDQYQQVDKNSFWKSFLSKGFNAQLKASKDSLSAVAVADRWKEYGLGFTEGAKDLFFIQKALNDGRYQEACRQLEVAVRKDKEKNIIYQVLYTLFSLRISGKMSVEQLPSRLVEWGEQCANYNDSISKDNGALTRTLLYSVVDDREKAEEWARKTKEYFETSPVKDQMNELIDSFVSLTKK